MSRLEKAREFRRKINASLQATRKLIRVDELSEEELTEMIDLYPQYEIGKSYVVGDVIKYEGELCKVIQEHTSLKNWVPSELPALYLNMMPENVIPEWKQSAGAHDAYKKDAIVKHEEKLWKNIYGDGNTWEPGVYGWEVVR